MRLYGTTPVKPQQLVMKAENKLNVILTFIVSPRAGWATFKKNKRCARGGDSVNPYKNIGCTTIKPL